MRGNDLSRSGKRFLFDNSKPAGRGYRGGVLCLFGLRLFDPPSNEFRIKTVVSGHFVC